MSTINQPLLFGQEETATSLQSQKVLELMERYPALSVQQPWAWAIVYAGKDIENRCWRHGIRYRGPLLIHAGQRWYDGSFDDTDRRLFQGTVDASGSTAVVPPDMPLGGIVGIVDLVDIVRHSTSRWFSGPLGLVLRNPRPLPFTPCKGALGLFSARL